MKKHLLVLPLVFAIGVLPAQACAPMAELENAVRVSDESAVIVWNSKTSEQHFIRKASFESKARDIGFLVPSPSTPQLAKAEDYVFGDFEQMMVPEVKYVEKHRWYQWQFTSMFSRIKHTFNAAGNVMTDDDDGVEVLQSERVAGYDATTVRARNVESLNRWLRKNGYVSSPEFASWLKPYVEKRWVITAFKISKKTGKSDKFSSSLVRMTFKTPRPFFPYSEPQNAKSKGGKSPRSLRIFFLSDARYKATPQNFGKFAAWPGKVVWSDSLSGNMQQTKQDMAADLALPVRAISVGQWLTVFEDNSSPRPGTRDVYFERDENAVKHLPPIISVRWTPRTIFIEPILFVAGVLFLVGVAFVNRRKTA